MDIKQATDYWTDEDTIFLRRLQHSKDVKNFNHFKQNTIWHCIADNSKNVEKPKTNYELIFFAFSSAVSFLIYSLSLDYVHLIMFAMFFLPLLVVLKTLPPAPIYNKYYILTNQFLYIFHDLGKSKQLKFIQYTPIHQFTALLMQDKGIALYTDSMNPILLEIPLQKQTTLQNILLTLRPNDITDASK